MKLVRVYKSGLHLGEEKIVHGNECSGMVYFSGCHLSCSFCYTPEISFRNQGTAINEDSGFEFFEDLVRRGARNLNLISPFHVWTTIRKPLIKIRERYPRLILILKTSGFEPVSWVEEMGQIANIWIPDYKVYGKSEAQSVKLPVTYGTVTADSISRALRIWPDAVVEEGTLRSGVLVRHLMMPGYFEDSLQVIRSLAEMGFRSYLNLMTYFVDPVTRRIHNANPSEVELLSSEAYSHGMVVLVNGRVAAQEASRWAN